MLLSIPQMMFYRIQSESIDDIPETTSRVERLCCTQFPTVFIYALSLQKTDCQHSEEIHVCRINYHKILHTLYVVVEKDLENKRYMR